MGEMPQSPNTDEEGYLIEPQDWNEYLARKFALKENIPLTEDHWDAIRFMREYYADHQIAPDVRHVMKHLAKRIVSESRNAVFELFPYGYVKQACKIVGMKRPPRLEYRLSRAGAVWYQLWHQFAQTLRASAKMHPFQFFPIPNSWQPLRCASYHCCY